jgi:RNA polymerase sigma factor (sigma-70 family)
LITILPETIFRNVYNQYWELLYRIANKKTNSHHDALDIVQETFTYIWQHVAVLQQIDDTKLRSYLVTCLYYRIMNYFRTNNLKDKHLHFFSLQADQETTQHVPQNEPELEAINTAIMGELDKMPERMKEIFLLNHLENKSVEEIAKVYNISNKTVRNQVSIAKKRLKAFADSYPVTELAPLILLFLLKD